MRTQEACRHGHAFTPDNVYEREYGGYRRRYCRTCQRQRSAAASAAMRLYRELIAA